MRISDIARQTQAFKTLAQQGVLNGSATGSTSENQSANSPKVTKALAAAQEQTANKIGAAQRAGAAALAVSDSTKAIDQGVADLKALVTKAADVKLTPEGRDALQKQFATALAKVETASAQQAKDLAKEPLATSSVRPLATDALGLGVKPVAGPQHLDDLKSLDLRTASVDDLAAASRVLDAAKSQTGKQTVQSDKLVAGFSRQITTLENSAANLAGTTQDVRTQRQAQVLAALSQPLQTSGSLVNLFA